MQVNNEDRKAERKASKLVKRILRCIAVICWIVTLIFCSIVLFPVFLLTEVSFQSMMILILLVSIVIIFMMKLFETVELKVKTCRIIGIITAITLFWIPCILQLVYRATEDNVIKTEETNIVDSRQIRFYSDEDSIEYPTEEEDIFTIQLDGYCVFPVEEVIQYRTTLTIDNKNPWGRKTTQTIKEWKEYTLYVPNPTSIFAPKVE